MKYNNQRYRIYFNGTEIRKVGIGESIYNNIIKDYNEKLYPFIKQLQLELYQDQDNNYNIMVNGATEEMYNYLTEEQGNKIFFGVRVHKNRKGDGRNYVTIPFKTDIEEIPFIKEVSQEFKSLQPFSINYDIQLRDLITSLDLGNHKAFSKLGLARYRSFDFIIIGAKKYKEGTNIFESYKEIFYGDLTRESSTMKYKIMFEQPDNRFVKK